MSYGVQYDKKLVKEKHDAFRHKKHVSHIAAYFFRKLCYLEFVDTENYLNVSALP